MVSEMLVPFTGPDMRNKQAGLKRQTQDVDLPAYRCASVLTVETGTYCCCTSWCYKKIVCSMTP